MPGWIIQGVRGEGKSLCAVAKIREYLDRGCPVATNLDLYLDALLPEHNSTLAYRLPDWPRFQDFYMLPPAYDPAYKGEDKNGLIVLDEMALWCNSREWKDKGRKNLVSWLLQSRKDHWDLILLCQDHEMLDKQVKTTCCDYLVQASRTDRRKIPYLGPLLEFMFLDPKMPKLHVYDVYYGLNATDARVDRWTYSGKSIYDGYDTNQKFKDGMELVGSRLMDMRAVYTYLPACYLTKQIYIERLQSQIEEIEQAGPIIEEGETMAKKRTISADSQKTKIMLMSIFLVGFLVWRFGFGEVKLPGGDKQAVTAAAPVQPKPAKDQSASVPGYGEQNNIVSVSGGSSAFVERLITSYRPRLAGYLYNSDKGSYGIIEFYQGDTMVERFRLSDLRAMGVAIVHKSYGVDVVAGSGVYTVSPWPRPFANSSNPENATQQNGAVSFAQLSTNGK